MKKVLCLFLIAIVFINPFSNVAFAIDIETSTKTNITKDLANRIATLAKDETINVAIWIEDIEAKEIEKKTLKRIETNEKSFSLFTEKQQARIYKDTEIKVTVEEYKNKNSNIKMAMCWNKKISFVGGNTTMEIPHENYRLEVYYGTNTSGTPVEFSNTPYTNTELLQFSVIQPGTYTVVVKDVSPTVSTGHTVSIAWY